MPTAPEERVLKRREMGFTAGAVEVDRGRRR